MFYLCFSSSYLSRGPAVLRMAWKFPWCDYPFGLGMATALLVTNLGYLGRVKPVTSYHDLDSSSSRHEI